MQSFLQFFFAKANLFLQFCFSVTKYFLFFICFFLGLSFTVIYIFYIFFQFHTTLFLETCIADTYDLKKIHIGATCTHISQCIKYHYCKRVISLSLHNFCMGCCSDTFLKYSQCFKVAGRIVVQNQRYWPNQSVSAHFSADAHIVWGDSQAQSCLMFSAPFGWSKWCEDCRKSG